MVSKEECKDAINNFIKTGDIEYTLTLLDYLCQVKELSEEKKAEAIRTIGLTFGVLSAILPDILEELERHFGLNRVTDKNNNLILVY